MSAQKNSQSTKQKNYAAAARIAAGAIACIGIGAPILLSGCSKNPVDSSIGTTDSLYGTPDTPTVTYKRICDNVEGDLQTKSDGAEDTPTLLTQGKRIMQAESGWYYVKRAYTDSGSYIRIYYHDAATGEDVALCAKPDCTHNNEYCTAQNSKYQGMPCIYYEGYLYGISGDDYTDEPLKHEPGPVAFTDCGDIALIRYAPDGTELSKMVSLQDAVPESLENVAPETVSIIGHRGALWISVGFRRTIEEFHRDEVDGKPLEYYSGIENQGGYGLFHYDIESEKLTAVYYQPLKDKFYCSTPYQMQGVGDYVYFKKSNVDWGDALNGDNVYRVDIRSGAIERVSKNVFEKYLVAGDKMLSLEEKQITNQPVRYLPRVMDLATGESRLFLGDEDYVTDFTCTEDYVLLVGAAGLSVYDWDGKLLQENISLPADAICEDGSLREMHPALAGDKLYLQTHKADYSSVTYVTGLSAAAEKGSTDWKELWQDEVYE